MKRGSKKYTGYVCFVMVLLCALPLTGRAQVETGPLRKCWDVTAEILAKAGVSSDASNVYFMTSDGVLRSVEAGSGKQVWTAELGGEVSLPIHMGKRSLIAITTGAKAADSDAKSYLRSISPVTGITNWRTELPQAAIYYLGVSDYGAAVVTSNSEILIISEVDGRVTSRSSLNGQLTGKPGFGEHTIVLATKANSLEMIDASDGKLKASIKLKEPPFAFATFDDSYAVISNDRGSIWTIGPGDQGPKWKFKIGGRATDIRSIGDRVLIASTDNFVYFMSAETGNVLWKRRLPGRIASVAMIDPGSVAVTVVGERSAYIINTEDGKFGDAIRLTGEEEFLMTPIKANGSMLLVSSTSGISGYSEACGNEKSGK